MSAEIKFIGLDVHRDTIAIAIAEGDMKQEVRFLERWLTPVKLCDPL